MNKISYKPVPCLTAYIDRIYVLDAPSSFLFPKILPGTGLELLFHLDAPFLINEQKSDIAHIVCPRKKNYQISTANSGVSCIAVRFRSGAFRHFTSIPYHELNDQFISVLDIWGIKGSCFIDQLYECETILDKIERIQYFLLKSLHHHQAVKDVKWDTIIHMLYKNHEELKLRDLAKYTHLGYRQFERNFKVQFGITPKKFQQLTRFQATVKELLLDRKSDYLETVLGNGYYDQSHFIKEFQYFVGEKPKKYFQDDNFNHHFYDRKLKSF